MTPDDATRLGGEVGDAINASGLVHARAITNLNPETGKSEFVGRERMMQLLAGYPTLHARIRERNKRVGRGHRQVSACTPSINH